MNINFNPMAFIDNLVYMGAGMFSIFVVILAIIIVVYGLNKFTAPKNDNEQ